MKKIALIVMVLTSCQNAPTNDSVENSYDSVDSIINESVNKKMDIKKMSDSSTKMISNKIEKTATTITNLKQEVKELKDENKALKSAIDDNDNVGKPFDLRPISNNKGNQR